MKRSFNKFSLLAILFGVTMLNTVYGQALKGWKTMGDAKWKSSEGIIESEPGEKGFLVSTTSYTDFTITLEFMNDGNFSGVFLRCTDPQKISVKTAYKAPINRDNPENPEFTTGGISGVSKPSVVMVTADKWNKYEIMVKGKRIVVKLNGTQTVDAESELYKSGPIALQTSGGVTKFRNIVIKPL